MSYDPRFVYRVRGRVSPTVRVALDARYGPDGWYSPYEEALRDEEARTKLAAGSKFFDTSYVYRPALDLAVEGLQTRGRVTVFSTPSATADPLLELFAATPWTKPDLG